MGVRPNKEIVNFEEDAKKPFAQINKILIKSQSLLKHQKNNDVTSEKEDNADDLKSEDDLK